MRRVIQPDELRKMNVRLGQRDGLRKGQHWFLGDSDAVLVLLGDGRAVVVSGLDMLANRDKDLTTLAQEIAYDEERCAQPGK